MVGGVKRVPFTVDSGDRLGPFLLLIYVPGNEVFGCSCGLSYLEIF